MFYLDFAGQTGMCLVIEKPTTHILLNDQTGLEGGSQSSASTRAQVSYKCKPQHGNQSYKY